MRSRLVPGIVLLLATTAARADDAGYAAEMSKWRADREAELRAEDGWLTVAGLFWLQEGANRVGSASDNEVILPAGPPHAGVLEHHGSTTTLRVEPGVDMRRGPEAIAASELKADTAGGPDVITLGRLSFSVIFRGGKYGVRVRDLDSPRRKTFAGRAWFPVAPRARITARFVAYDPPRTLEVPNVLGQVIPMPSPGRALFHIDGKEVGLDAVLESPDAKELFFVFNDATSGKDTYAGGRFLYSELPGGGTVVLDFNKAHSPPCAFTPFATCPLPPRQNRLTVRIEAGERFARH